MNIMYYSFGSAVNVRVAFDYPKQDIKLPSAHTLTKNLHERLKDGRIFENKLLIVQETDQNTVVTMYTK